MSKSSYPDLIEKLTSIGAIGFTQQQAAAYIAILQIGGGSGSAIAQASGINRSKIYDVLSRLEEMNAVKIVPVDGKKRYVPVPPSDLFPNILKRFKERLSDSEAELMAFSTPVLDISENTISLTKLNLKKLNTNDYDYIISTSINTRNELIDRLPKTNRPEIDVKILDMNIENEKGVILLINSDIAYIIPTPKGRIVDAVAIYSTDIIRLLIGMIENWWNNDIPNHIIQQIRSGSLRAIYRDKAIKMLFKMKDGREYRYDRPVSFICTDSHIIFYYQEQEDPKIPILAISDITIDKNEIWIKLSDPSMRHLADLYIKTVQDPIYLKGLLETLSPKIN